ncbi:guanylate-binding protein 3-like [Ruditapes philippinarum]|uniref:guanylate-binding protein 3-like n=1 Tax=Ruditapes philippinarum TaxID=129788 RepID=UPI00295BCE17|nr:guanylate-binding protein 3-like [Ruditapes philippinarum]
MSDVSEIYKGLDIFQRPQCLIETDKDGFLTIVLETANQIKQITSAVNVVAIAGLYRTGKSYLMNRLAGETEGFALGKAVQSKTKGIWAWCREHPTQKAQVLLLLDTEGLGDAEKGSQDHDNKIVIISTLISSTLVYNMMTAFNQDTIEKLTYPF